MHTFQKKTTRALPLMAALVIGLLFSVDLAQAQTEEDALRYARRNPATGARMIGMGGASIGGVADWSAVFSNPAGLGLIQNSQLVGSLNTLSAASDAEYRIPGFSEFQNADVNRTSLANFGYVYKAPTTVGSLAFGVGFNQSNTFERALIFQGDNNLNSITDYFMPLPGEFSIEQDAGDDEVFDTDDDEFSVDFFRDLSFYAYETFGIDFDRGLYDAGDEVPFLPAVTAGTVQQTGEVFEEGGTSEVSFGGAVEAARGVMVGASTNFTFGSYRFERYFEEVDVNNANDGSGSTTDFASLQLREDLETDLFGVNVRGGVSARVLPNVRVGLTVETPTYISVDETFGTDLQTTFDNGDNYSYSETLPAADYRITTPWRFGAGVTFDFMGLILSGDVEAVDWSQMRMRDGAGGNQDYFDDLNRIIRGDYEPVLNTRVGAEYTVGPVALRLGYGVQPSPFESDSDDLDRTRTYTAAGIGFIAGSQLQINLGWQREQFDDRYLPYSEVADAPVVFEDVKRDKLTVGVQFSF